MLLEVVGKAYAVTCCDLPAFQCLRSLLAGHPLRWEVRYATTCRCASSRRRGAVIPVVGRALIANPDLVER